MVREQVILFLIALVFLVYFSEKDLRTRKIDNFYLLFFLIVGLFVYSSWKSLILVIGGMALMFVFVWLLWTKEVFGGADAKLLIALVPFLNIHSILEVVNFMVLLMLTSWIYFYFVKNKKKIAYVPVITINYVLFWLIKSLNISLQILQ